MSTQRAAFENERWTSPDLAAAIARRETEALEDLYDAYAPRAFGLAFKVLRDTQAAEDVVHDAFLWLWEHGDRIDPTRGTAGALLLTVTHRRAIDALRRTSRWRKREQHTEIDPIDHDALAHLTRIEEESISDCIRAGIASLPQAQREAVELAYFGGMTQTEIAERQDVALGTVKSRTRLALGRLRTFLGGAHHADV